MWQYDEQWMSEVVGPMFYNLYKLKGRVFGDDPQAVVWPSRTLADIYQNNMDPTSSFHKHANECADALGVPRPFNYPSRDQIVNVGGNFCNLFDKDDIPIFDIFISSLIAQQTNESISKAYEWINILKQGGATHINLAISYDYAEDLGWAPRYPIEGHDFTNDLLGFSQVIDWVIAMGLIPIIKLSCDGQDPDPIGKSYGWKWGMDNVPSIVSYLSRFIPQGMFSSGFDGCFPNWSPTQTTQFLAMLRSCVGSTGCIDTEFSGPGTVGYSHMGNGAADWEDDKLGMLDNFSIEVMTFPTDSVGLQQTAARLLGPAKRNIAPENDGPYYLAATTKKVNICHYENIAYQISRKRASSADAVNMANFGKNFGFSSFGNGLPSAR